MKEEWTADGDHPSIEGYRRLGELAFSASLRLSFGRRSSAGGSPLSP